MIKKVIGKSLDNALRCGIHLPIHHGGIHDMDIWYYRFNVRIHCLDVAMGIGTLVLIFW
jgi:hypothetical protein